VARKVDLKPGETIETVTQERLISAEDAARAEERNISDGGSRDLFEFAAEIPVEQYGDYIMYVYRLAPEKYDAYITKIVLPFDEATIGETCGGGTYKLILKKGSEIRRSHANFRVPGLPKDMASAPMQTVRTSATPVADSDTIAALKLALATNPNALNADLMKSAFLSALEIQRAAGIGAVQNQFTTKDMFEMMMRLEERRAPAAAAASMPEWATQLIAGIIPVAVGLFGKILEPKDPLTQIRSITETMEVLKTITGSSGAGKPDTLQTVLSNIGPILKEGTGLLAEARQAAILREAALARQQPAHTGPITVQANPALHTPPPAAPIVHRAVPMPPVDVSAVQQGAPSPQLLIGKIKKMIEENIESPGYIVDFIEEWMPDVYATMLTLDLETFRTLVSQTDELKPVITLPHFEKYLTGMHKELQARAQGQPLPN
jgi:hypothetical protein